MDPGENDFATPVVCQITYHNGRYVKLSDGKMHVKFLAQNLAYRKPSSFYTIKEMMNDLLVCGCKMEINE